MHTDVAVVGGSFAGLSAALQLARARRNVTVLDTGEPRNRFAKASHGFLTQDGARPADILAEARRQLAAYPTARFVEARAERASGIADAFSIALQDGDELSARRIILTHGVSDSLPDIPGLAAEWGKRVAHCPYCHGYEFGGGPLGVLAANGEVALHSRHAGARMGPCHALPQRRCRTGRGRIAAIRGARHRGRAQAGRGSRLKNGRPDGPIGRRNGRRHHRAVHPAAFASIHRHRRATRLLAYRRAFRPDPEGRRDEADYSAGRASPPATLPVLRPTCHSRSPMEPWQASPPTGRSSSPSARPR